MSPVKGKRFVQGRLIYRVTDAREPLSHLLYILDTYFLTPASPFLQDFKTCLRRVQRLHRILLRSKYMYYIAGFKNGWPMVPYLICRLFSRLLHCQNGPSTVEPTLLSKSCGNQKVPVGKESTTHCSYHRRYGKRLVYETF